ncbi:PKD domain-containing protein [Methylomonas sp. HYX-M1]|uniref:PKD domain-containing protein n=1 Tax=Methylomonas sp. HYX-M1 TaxID=3139307 RepID=UPI00345BB8DF
MMSSAFRYVCLYGVWHLPPLRSWAALSFAMAALLVLASSAAAQERARSLPNVVSQFQNLKHHGEWLGFNTGLYSFDDFHEQTDSIFTNTSSHWQGIQRFDAANGTPYWLVSRSSNASSSAGHLAVVQLASRDKDGERLRSNRLLKGEKTEDTSPPSQDKIVNLISFSDYQHIGGTQTVGNILAVPAEEKVDESADIPDGRIYFYDLSTLPNPTLLSYHLDIEGHKAGVVGITDLPDGRYLLALSWGYGDKIEFYKSNGSDWHDPNFAFSLHSEWNYYDLLGDQDWPWQFAFTVGGKDIPLSYSHQTLNFIKQDDGKLYLLGTHNTAPTAPSDYLGKDVGVLYQVGGTGDGETATLTSVVGQRFYSRSPGSVDPPLGFKIINFSASVGAYVSPSQELLLYATEHYAQGPSGSVQVAEFRHRDVYRAGSPNYYPTAKINAAGSVTVGNSVALSAAGSKPPKAKAWVELYADASGWQNQTASVEQTAVATWTFSPSSDRDRSLVIDAADIGKDDYNNFGDLDQTDGIITPKGFHDTASSVRYWAPPGCGPNLYEQDNYGGKVLNLRVESGYAADRIWVVSDLKNLAMRDSGGNSTGANDKTSSLTLTTAGCDQPLTKYTWSLGSGSVGSIADANGVQTKFVAGNVPGKATVKLTVCTATNLCNTGSQQIQVTQIGPLLEKVNGPAEVRKNHALTLDISFSNPDPAAQHSLKILWGDGTGVNETLPVSERFVSRSHSYAEAGNYQVAISISDQNRNSTSQTHVVTVTDPAPRIQAFSLTEQIQEGDSARLTVGFALSQPAEASIDWGDGSAAQDPRIGQSANNQVVADHVYADNGEYTVTISFDDGVDVISQSGTVRVGNAAPAITNAGINAQGLFLRFTDPGLSDRHTASVDWGDQTALSTQAIPVGNREFEVKHSYRPAAQGFGKAAYQVVVTVSDGVDSGSKTVTISVPKGDLDSDRDVDRNDLNLLLGERNKTVAASVCGSRCDLDGDGKITVNDGRKLSLLCTRSNCAPQ